MVIVQSFNLPSHQNHHKICRSKQAVIHKEAVTDLPKEAYEG